MGNNIGLEPKESFFTCDGLTLHYTEWGEPSTDTLVLIHGNRDHARSWDSLVTSLLSRNVPFSHLVSLDLRGHGDSQWPPPGKGYQHEDFLFDLAGLLRHLQQEAVTIVAHSLGGSVALMFAGCFPQRVKRLVLVEGVGPTARSVGEVPEVLAERLEDKDSASQNYSYPSLGAAVNAIKKRFPLIPTEMCAHMVQYGTKSENGGYVWKHDPRMRFRSQSILSEEQIRSFIERITCPTLLVFGSESDYLKTPRAPRIGLFKNSKIVKIQGAGHHVAHERPGELAQVISSFLGSDDG